MKYVVALLVVQLALVFLAALSFAIFCYRTRGED